ncbi:hypothetical protein [Parvularcula sp. IMCC14364]|uniref:hypothetical protein n=1 Tax=Parvularcula sp. IMCC14364 TaxID=3067902 RepID=UPI0027423058|nr:hypothetical protein [Parvularcula sp. IMCC14364]
MSEYRRRHSFLDRVERVYRLEEEAVIEIRPQKKIEIRLDDVVEFRLCHLPTTEKPNRYMTTIKNSKGECIQFDNMHYRAKGGLEERSLAYRDFVEPLVAALRAENPNLLVRSGGARWYYILRMMEGLGLALAVMLGILFIPMTDGWFSAIGILKIVAVLALLPLAVRWAIKIRPKLYPILNLPARVLPSEGQAA